MMVIRGHGPTRGMRRGALDGGNIWWLAPSYKNTIELWDDLKRATHGVWESKSEVDKRIRLVTGGTISVRSADSPESLRGSGLDGVVLDEAASMKEEIWKECIRPALMDKRGWATFIGTPKGFNWFYDLFQSVESRDEWERWQQPSYANPLIVQEELADFKNEGLRFYSQEVEAQFLQEGLGLFKREWFSGFVDRVPDSNHATQ